MAVERKWLADGVMEIRLIGDDGELDAVVELTRPAYHVGLVARLLSWQDECRELDAAPPGSVEVLAFPVHRVSA
jgi:hypothetical protein